VTGSALLLGRAEVPQPMVVAWASSGVTVVGVALVWAMPPGAVHAVLVIGHLLLCGWLALVDARTHRLPDAQVLAAGSATGLLAIALAVRLDDASALGGALLGMALYGGMLLVLHVLSPTSLGFGDVKFAAVLGLGLGVVNPWSVASAWLTALAVQAIVCAAHGARSRQRPVRVPLGPALVVAQCVVLVVA
jgi:leader peptidase (prepilin peptidase)/N-methyltransferase